MKKKDTLSKKDKDDWSQFIKDTSRVSDKDTVNTKNTYSNLRFRFDLHGFSLDEANEQVKTQTTTQAQTQTQKQPQPQRQK